MKPIFWNRRNLRTCFLLLAVASLAGVTWLTGFPIPGSAPLEAGFKAIFDGSTLEGWEGNPEWFRVRDGAIVGGSLDRAIPVNMFLSTTQEYRDFELRLSVRLLGDPAAANAGIQIRSRRVPGETEMIGYQADMGQQYWGCLYDESRRNRILAEADREKLEPVLSRQGWNDYVIRCEGRRIQLWINQVKTVDYLEAEEGIEQTGLIGLQIHRGPPSEAHYRDIRIQELGSASSAQLGKDSPPRFPADWKRVSVSVPAKLGSRPAIAVLFSGTLPGF